MLDDAAPIPTPDDPAPPPPTEAGGRRQIVVLALVAVSSIGLGFLFGRTVRQRTAAPPPADFLAAPAPDLGGTSPLGGDHPLVGQLAPAFTMTDLATGDRSSLSDYGGQPLLVNFWATWCPPCRMEMPWLQAASDRHQGEGLVVLAVDAGERVPPESVVTQIQSFVDLMGMTFPVLYGPEAEAMQLAWGVYGLPSSFLVDRGGTVVDVQVGMYPSQASLDARIATLLAGGS